MNNISNILKDNGLIAIIIVEGEGIKEDWSLLEVDGKKLRRTFYLYSKERLLKETKRGGMKLVKEGYLAPKLTEYGWKNYIFKINKKQNE